MIRPVVWMDRMDCMDRMDRMDVCMGSLPIRPSIHTKTGGLDDHFIKGITKELSGLREFYENLSVQLFLCCPKPKIC